jgi:hypothetical protein
MWPDVLCGPAHRFPATIEVGTGPEDGIRRYPKMPSFFSLSHGPLAWSAATGSPSGHNAVVDLV